MRKVRYVLVGFGGIAENRVAKEGFAWTVAGKPLTGDDAVHNLALCAAAHASARKGGKTVNVKD